MNLDYVRDEIARMRAQIRRLQNEVEMLRRAASAPFRQNCCWRGYEPRWLIFLIDERSYELPRRGKITPNNLLAVQ
jgi:hypothetical protein